MMHRSTYRAGVRNEAIGAGTIAGLVLGSLLVAAGIVWFLAAAGMVWDSHFARFANDTTAPSTVGLSLSRIDQGFSQLESAPAPVTAPAIKLELLPNNEE